MFNKKSRSFFWENKDFLNQGFKVTYPKSSIICLQNDSADKLFYINKGRVHLYFQGEEGKLQSVIYLETGDTFGILPFLLEKDKIGISATADDLSEIIILPKQIFLSVLCDNFSFMEDCAHYLAQFLWTMGKHINMLAFQDSYRKVLTILKSHAHENKMDENCTQVILQITHQQLADSTGLSRVTVTRVLNEFEKEQIIKKKAKSITIFLENLEKFCNKFY